MSEPIITAGVGTVELDFNDCPFAGDYCSWLAGHCWIIGGVTSEISRTDNGFMVSNVPEVRIPLVVDYLTDSLSRSRKTI